MKIQMESPERKQARTAFIMQHAEVLRPFVLPVPLTPPCSTIHSRAITYILGTIG